MMHHRDSTVVPVPYLFPTPRDLPSSLCPICFRLPAIYRRPCALFVSDSLTSRGVVLLPLPPTRRIHTNGH
jgi:hypothetical protein